MTHKSFLPTAEFNLQDEFWWLDLDESNLDGTVELGRSDWEPYPEFPPFVHEPSPVQLRCLARWVAAHGHENLHRSLDVLLKDGSPLNGPLMFDVDIVEEGFADDSPGPPDELLLAARDVTIQGLGFLDSKGITQDQRRVYFSGHKGFHIEFIDADISDSNDHRFILLLKDGRTAVSDIGLERVIIDLPKDFKRLNGTINAWGPTENRRRHRCIRLAESKLPDLDAATIWSSSAVENES